MEIMGGHCLLLSLRFLLHPVCFFLVLFSFFFLLLLLADLVVLLFINQAQLFYLLDRDTALPGPGRHHVVVGHYHSQIILVALRVLA